MEPARSGGLRPPAGATQGPGYTQILGHYLRPYRGNVALLALFLFSSTGLQLYVPQIVRSFIDGATRGAALQALTRLAVLYLGLAVVNQLLSAASTYLSASVGWSATNALRTDLFRHAVHLDMAYHKERTPGEMIERVDGDVTGISTFFSQFVVRVAGAALLMLGILVLLWREDWRVGLALTVFVAVATFILHRRREIAVPATQEEREASAGLFGFIEERLAGLDDLRANGAGRYAMHRFLLTQREWFARLRRAWMLRAGIWLSMGTLFSIGYILTLGLGVGLFQAGAITLGTVYLFYNYMSMLEAPLEQITQQLQEFQKAAAGMRRVSELMAVERTVPDGDKALSAHKALSTEFRNVSFSYEDQQVLKNLSFRLEAGETLGLLGRTGSGKTTLIRLLFRLYDPTQGQILLGGADMRTFQLSDLRRGVGLVTQDVQLFHASVRDNLTFFDPGISDERIRAVLGKLGMLEWLEGLPQGLDTELRAGGSGLSAGESQLLAFTRVFLKDPQLVILDEPSSRLDPATERLLTQAIDRLLEGRTGIIIAHRLETVERVDKIMVLGHGEILEFDSRTKLEADPNSRYHLMLQIADDGGMDSQLERLGA